MLDTGLFFKTAVQVESIQNSIKSKIRTPVLIICEFLCITISPFLCYFRLHLVSLRLTLKSLVSISMRIINLCIQFVLRCQD